jgi:hypothetical protein
LILEGLIKRIMKRAGNDLAAGSYRSHQPAPLSPTMLRTVPGHVAANN